MLAIYKFLKKFLVVFVDIAFIIQIVTSVTIFAFVMYWFLDLINYQFLEFLTPVANSITEFMHSYFESSLSKGVNQTDGSLFIFIMILLVLIGSLTQLKVYSVHLSNWANKRITKIKLKQEDEFNAQLRAEADQAILAYKNVVLIIKLEARKRIVDELRSDSEIEKEQKAVVDNLVCTLYSRIKDAPCCKFAKSGNQLVVSLKGFVYVNKLLYYVDKSLEEMRSELRKENWILKYYGAIDAFDDNALLKDVYYDLQILLRLNLYNEIICYGNFCNRYYMESQNMFEAYLKGVYDVTEPENVWTLVKKY